MASLGRAVTSTLELLAGYSYHPLPDPEPAELGVAQLQPLGDAAKVLLQEKNVLRSQMSKLKDQLNTQVKATKVYSAHLTELIRRVRTLQQEDLVESLLQGIEIPRPEDISQSIFALLQTSCDIRSLSRTRLASLDSSLVLEDRVDLPLINSYLDRTWEKARKSVENYAKLEMTEEPTILRAWKSIELDLEEKAREDRPLTELIRFKAEALHALKAAESVSLDEAVLSFQRLKSKFESMISESESWVVTEMFHQRIQSTPQLQSAIARRVHLISQPLTISTLRELSDIYEEYEDQRKSAVLRPWISRVQPELEWWKMVNLVKQVVDASERNYRAMAGRDAGEFRSVVDNLQREMTTDTEGVYTFLFSLLEELKKLESLKQTCLSISSRECLSESLRDLLHSYLEFAMVFAALCDEPGTECVRFESFLSKPDCDLYELICPMKTVLRNSLTDWKTRIAEKLSLTWVLPILHQCLASTFDPESREAIDKEISLVEAEGLDGTGTYSEQVARIGDIVGRTITRLSSDAGERRGGGNSEEWDWMRHGVNSAIQDLRDICLSLSQSSHPEVLPIASQLDNSQFPSLSPSDQLSLLSSSLSAVSSHLLGSHSKVISPSQACRGQSAIDIAINVAFGAALALAEATAKANNQSYSGAETAQGWKLSEKLRFVTGAINRAEAFLTADSERESMVIRLKEAVEESGRQAEDLARRTSGGESEGKIREAVLSIKAKAEETGVGGWLDALGQTQELARQQVALRLSSDLKGAPGETHTRKPPSRKLSGVAPAYDKVQDGLDQLLFTATTLVSDLSVPIDQQVRVPKLAQIAAANGSEKSVLQENLIMYQLREIQEVMKQRAEGRYGRMMDALIAVVDVYEDLSPRIAAISAAQASTRTPLYALTEEAESLLLETLRRPAVMAGQPGSVYAAVRKLLSVYEEELPGQKIHLMCSQEEEAAMMSQDWQTRAVAYLTVMEKGLKALSGKATAYKQEINREREHFSSISTKVLEGVMSVMHCLSEKEWTDFWARQSPFEDDWKKTVNAAMWIGDLTGRLMEKIRRANEGVECSDIVSLIESNLVRIAPIPPSSISSKCVSKSQSTSTKQSFLSELEKNVEKVTESALHIFQLQNMDSLVETGRKVAKACVSDGDQVETMRKKLEFLKEALDAYCLSYRQAAVQPWIAVFDLAKQNLTTARHLLKDPAKTQQVAISLDQLTLREDSTSIDIRDGLEMVEIKMELVLGELRLDWAEAITEGTPGDRKRLAAVPTGLAEKESQSWEPLFHTANEVLASLSVSEDSPRQSGAVPPYSHSSLHSQLISIQASMRRDFQYLIDRLLAQINRLGRTQGKDQDFFTALGEIDRMAKENGVNMALVVGVEEVLECLMGEVQGERDRKVGHEGLKTGMDELVAVGGEIAGLLGLPDSESERVSYISQIGESTSIDRLLLQQTLLQHDLKASRAKLQSSLTTALRCLHTHSVKLVPFVTPAAAQAELTESFQRAARIGSPVDIDQIVALSQSISHLALASPFGSLEYEDLPEIEAVPSHVQHRRTLSAVPTTSDKYSHGMTIILKEMTELASKMDLEEPDEAKMTEIEASTGIEKVILQQSLARSELIRLQTGLSTMLTRSLQTLLAALQSFRLSPSQQSRLFNLSQVKKARIHHVIEAEELLIRSVVQVGEYEETEGQAQGDGVSMDRKKLSAVPNSVDKVGKGMDFLLRTTGRLLSLLQIEFDAKQSLSTISSSDGQDKVLLQQTLLHRELTEIEGKVTEITDREKVKTRQEGDGNWIEMTVERVGNLMDVLQIRPESEAVSLCEAIQAAETHHKTHLQTQLISLDLDILATRATQLLETHNSEQVSLNALVSRLKASLEAALGPGFSSDWSRAVDSPVVDRLTTVANGVEKVCQRAEAATVVAGKVSSLVPLLQSIAMAEVQSRLDSQDSVQILETTAVALQTVFSSYKAEAEQREAQRREAEEGLAGLKQRVRAVVSMFTPGDEGNKGNKPEEQPCEESDISVSIPLLAQSLESAEQQLRKLLGDITLSCAALLAVLGSPAPASVTASPLPALAYLESQLESFKTRLVPDPKGPKMTVFQAIDAIITDQECRRRAESETTVQLQSAFAQLCSFLVRLQSCDIEEDLLEAITAAHGLIQSDKSVIAQVGEGIASAVELAGKVIGQLTDTIKKRDEQEFRQAFNPLVSLPEDMSFSALIRSVVEQIDSSCQKLHIDPSKPRRLSLCLTTAVKNKSKLAILENNLNDIMQTIDVDEDEREAQQTAIIKKLDELKQRERELGSVLGGWMREGLKTIQFAGTTFSLNLMRIDPRFERVDSQLALLEQHADGISGAKTVEEVSAAVRSLITDFITSQVAYCRCLTWSWKLRESILPPFQILKDFILQESSERALLAQARSLTINDTHFILLCDVVEREMLAWEAQVRKAIDLDKREEVKNGEEGLKAAEEIISQEKKLEELRETVKRLKADKPCEPGSMMTD